MLASGGPTLGSRLQENKPRNLWCFKHSGYIHPDRETRTTALLGRHCLQEETLRILPQAPFVFMLKGLLSLETHDAQNYSQAPNSQSVI